MLRLFFLILICLPSSHLLAQKPEDMIKKGRALNSMKKYNHALTEFDRVLKNQPNNVEAQIGRLDALKGMKKSGEIKAFSQKRTKASTADTHVVGAQLRILARDRPGAAAELNKALAINKNHYLANNLMAFIRRSEKNTDSALAHLKTAMAANPDYPETYYDLGDIYFVKGDTNRAVQYWREYQKRVPRMGQRYEYVKKMLNKLGAL